MTDLLLYAIESGHVDWDELPAECEQSWLYHTDDYHLVRFASDPHLDADAVGWIWWRNEDTWKIWARAGYEVCLPGGYWEPCDPDAAKAAILA